MGCREQFNMNTKLIMLTLYQVNDGTNARKTRYAKYMPSTELFYLLIASSAFYCKTKSKHVGIIKPMERKRKRRKATKREKGKRMM